jgi:hypothetical protein
MRKISPSPHSGFPIFFVDHHVMMFKGKVAHLPEMMTQRMEALCNLNLILQEDVARAKRSDNIFSIT